MRLILPTIRLGGSFPFAHAHHLPARSLPQLRVRHAGRCAIGHVPTPTSQKWPCSGCARRDFGAPLESVGSHDRQTCEVPEERSRGKSSLSCCPKIGVHLNASESSFEKFADFSVVLICPRRDPLAQQPHPPRDIAQSRANFGNSIGIVANRVEVVFGGLCGRTILLSPQRAKHSPASCDFGVAPRFHHIGTRTQNEVEMVVLST